MGLVKTALGWMAFIILLVAATYLIFVAWLPTTNPTIRKYQVEIGGAGETLEVLAPGPQKVEQKGDWITVEGIWSDPPGAYIGDIFVRLNKPPKRLKLLIVVEKGPVKAKVFCVLKLDENGVPGWTPIYDLVFNEGEYVVDVYFNEEGPKGFLKRCEEWKSILEMKSHCKPFPGRIYRLLVNGEEVRWEGHSAPRIIPHIGGQDKYWHFTIYFDYEENFSLKVKILEKE